MNHLSLIEKSQFFGTLKGSEDLWIPAGHALVTQKIDYILEPSESLRLASLKWCINSKMNDEAIGIGVNVISSDSFAGVYFPRLGGQSDIEWPCIKNTTTKSQTYYLEIILFSLDCDTFILSLGTKWSLAINQNPGDDYSLPSSDDKTIYISAKNAPFKRYGNLINIEFLRGKGINRAGNS